MFYFILLLSKELFHVKEEMKSGRERRRVHSKTTRVSLIVAELLAIWTMSVSMTTTIIGRGRADIGDVARAEGLRDAVLGATCQFVMKLPRGSVLKGNDLSSPKNR